LTIFVLEATSVQLDKSTLIIYKVDYELMHKHLRHPSKDILTNAPNCIKGFPKDLEVPSNLPVCPSYAQGKMPASTHPSLLDLRRSRVVGHDTRWRAHVVHHISHIPRVHLIPSVHSATTELRGEYIHIYYLSNTPLTHCT